MLFRSVLLIPTGQLKTVSMHISAESEKRLEMNRDSGHNGLGSIKIEMSATGEMLVAESVC